MFGFCCLFRQINYCRQPRICLQQNRIHCKPHNYGNIPHDRIPITCCAPSSSVRRTSVEQMFHLCYSLFLSVCGDKGERKYSATYIFMLYSVLCASARVCSYSHARNHDSSSDNEGQRQSPRNVYPRAACGKLQTYSFTDTFCRQLHPCTMHLSPLSPHVSQNLENLLQVFRPLSPGAQPVSRTRAPVFAAQISEENCRVPSCLLQDKEEHSPETVSTLTSAGEGTSTRGSTSRIFFLMLYRTRFPSLTRRASSTSTYQQLLSSQMSRISLTRSCYGLSPKIHTRCLKSLCCSPSFYFIIIFLGCLCIQSLSSASVTRR